MSDMHSDSCLNSSASGFDEIIFNMQVVSNISVGSRFCMMALKPVAGPAPDLKPGQFVNIAVAGKFLRRPVSVFDFYDGILFLLYEVVGEGTSIMSRWEPGALVNMLAPLGNGFNCNLPVQRPLLIGGGVGAAPLFFLAKSLLCRKIKPSVLLGFRDSRSAVLVREFSALCPAFVSTEDGSLPDGINPECFVKGRVTDLVDKKLVFGDYFYTCGPLPMMRAVCESLDIPGEVSLESRMGCGFGVCMCCSVQSESGAKRICCDGPVFDKNDLIWK